MRAWIFGGALLTLAAGACDCGTDPELRALEPEVRATPNPLAFGAVYTHTSATRVLRVENTGTAVLTVTSVRVKEGSDPKLAVADLSAQLAPAEARDVEVRLGASDAEGVRAGAILIASDDPDTPILEVPVTAGAGKRPGPAIEVCVDAPGQPTTCADPLRVAFGAVALGVTRTATVTLRSAGTEPLQIAQARAEPGAHPSFTFTPPDVAETLAPGESRTVRARFTPSTDAEVSAVLKILSNDPQHDLATVVFNGGGVAPALCARPESIDFGAVTIGASAERDVELESCGSVPLSIDAITLVSREFSIVAGAPQTLAPGAKLTVRLRYAPLDPGTDRERLVIDTPLPDAFVELTGRSASCDLSAIPAAIDLGAVAAMRTARRTILVENSGTVACAVTGVSLQMGTSSEFSLPGLPTFPAAVMPGASLSFEVAYAPADAGNDTGAVIIAGEDPAEPTLRVTIAGHRLGIGECELSVVPDPIAFGVVPLGTSRMLGVQLTNTGSSLCLIPSMSMSRSGSSDFEVIVPANPPVLLSGRSTTINLLFHPMVVGPQTSGLELFTGANPLRPTLTVPVTGTGSGPKLCVDPSLLAFGTHPVGQATIRSARLTACGTETIAVSRLDLVPPTSPEFQLSLTPQLPLTIRAGATVQVDLRYTGADLGRDDGQMSIASNDPLSPVQLVDLVAASANGPCGDIVGKVCGLGGAGPVAGARVYVDTPSGRVEARTNGQGDFVLTCVPPGAWMVRAESGSWSTEFPATSSAGTVTSVPGQHCLDPMSARVAVVWGRWDSMQDILTPLGVPVDVYGSDTGGPSAAALLLDPMELANYDIVFLNCGYDESLVLSGAGLQNIRDFVMNGGSLYASDWAYDVLEVAWPNAVDYYNDDTIENDAQSAGNFSNLVNVVDPSLRQALGGRAQVQITSCCTGIEAAGAGTTVYLEGDRFRNGGTHPFFVSFVPGMGSGRVLYTDFHNVGQRDINTIFHWLIAQL